MNFLLDDYIDKQLRTQDSSDNTCPRKLLVTTQKESAELIEVK